MGFRSEDRLEVHVLGLGCFLTSVLLVLPAPTLHTLSCYYCPLQNKDSPCANVTSQCSPNQHCASSRGYYGAVHVLSAQGCVDAARCGSREVTTYRGAKYNVTHSCCYKNTCNELLGKSAGKTGVSDASREDPRDSFSSYTTTSAPNATDALSRQS